MNFQQEKFEKLNIKLRFDVYFTSDKIMLDHFDLKKYSSRILLKHEKLMAAYIISAP